jgi:hypothetical protein
MEEEKGVKNFEPAAAPFTAAWRIWIKSESDFAFSCLQFLFVLKSALNQILS